MCTLTYVPLRNGRIITANRDESPSRSAAILSPYFSTDNTSFYIAEEPLRGGTNIALGQNGRHSVLLNGAFKPHDMHKRYGLSRGIVLLKSLECKNAFEFSTKFPFKEENVQPFTLVDFSDLIREVRWDGEKVYKKEYSTGLPHLWASAQMYNETAQRNRTQWFRELLEKGNINANKLLDFHFHGGNGDLENDMVMNRGDLVCTVSITQISETDDLRAIKHYDLVSNHKTVYTFGN